MIEEQKNNPLHGVKLEALLTELVDHYGWEVLAGEIKINCFKSNPSIKSSLKFLRKTPWAREKLEGFYLYKYKRLPKPDDVQYELPPRDRIVPLSQKPRTPAVITTKKPPANKGSQQDGRAPGTNRPASEGGPGQKSKPDAPGKPSNDVWGHWRKDS